MKRRKNPVCFWTEIGTVLRHHGAVIPASLSSSLLSLAILRPILALEPVKQIIDAAGAWGGGALCFAAMTGLWWGIFRIATNPLSKWGAKKLGLPSEVEETGLAERYWKMYAFGFNLAQFFAQSIMLNAGMEPKVAQTWNSLVGNVLWLAPLPFVRYGFQKLAQKASGKEKNLPVS